MLPMLIFYLPACLKRDLKRHMKAGSGYFQILENYVQINEIQLLPLHLICSSHDCKLKKKNQQNKKINSHVFSTVLYDVFILGHSFLKLASRSVILKCKFGI